MNPLENRLSADGQTLFVSSSGTNEVRKYNATTGAFIGLAAGSPRVGPVGQLVLPNGPEMLVTGWQSNTIFKFAADGSNTYLGAFTTGGTLNRPNNLALLTVPEPASCALILSALPFVLRYTARPRRDRRGGPARQNSRERGTHGQEQQ
jgi:hypothetical protein